MALHSKALSSSREQAGFQEIESPRGRYSRLGGLPMEPDKPPLALATVPVTAALA
jgi:hypothetical protein